SFDEEHEGHGGQQQNRFQTDDGASGRRGHREEGDADTHAQRDSFAQLEEQLMITRAGTITLLMSLALLACATRPHPTTVQTAASSTPTDKRNSIQLTSTAFNDGQPMPRQFTCDGVNVSPPLEWKGV